MNSRNPRLLSDMELEEIAFSKLKSSRKKEGEIFEMVELATNVLSPNLRILRVNPKTLKYV